MLNYFDNMEILYDEKNIPYTGIFNDIDFRKYKTYFKTYRIKPEEQYRPDKIAWKLLKSQDLSWILDSINNFETGIKEYTQDRIIYYLDIQFLNNLGII